MICILVVHICVHVHLLVLLIHFWMHWPISVKFGLLVEGSKLLWFSGNNIQEDGLVYAVVEEKISLAHLLIDTKESTEETAL